MIIQDSRVYEKAKWVALVFLPALGALVFGLGNVWDFAYTDQSVGTITCIDAFLGVLLGISTKQYYNDPENFDGDLFIAEGSGEMPEVNAVFADNPSSFKDRGTVTLRTQVVDVEPKNPLQGR